MFIEADCKQSTPWLPALDRGIACIVDTTNFHPELGAVVMEEKIKDDVERHGLRELDAHDALLAVALAAGRLVEVAPVARVHHRRNT